MFRIFAVAAVPASPRQPQRRSITPSAPWCAVISLGAGDVHRECIYRSIEQCRTTILAGNRGFCNPNPYYVGASERRRSRRARPY